VVEQPLPGHLSARTLGLLPPGAQGDSPQAGQALELRTVGDTAPGAKDARTGSAIALLLLPCRVWKNLLAALVTGIDPSEQSVIFLVGAYFDLGTGEEGEEVRHNSYRAAHTL
jgi:hypothetical protein